MLLVRGRDDTTSRTARGECELQRGVGWFTSETGRQKFLAAYDAAMELWPVPRQALDLETTYGTTHVHRYGPAKGDPIVLLHGAAGNSSMWFPNVAALGREHPLVAIDTLGDPGRSVQHRPVFEPETSAAWLEEVLAGLGIDRAHLVGSSYGGWIALNQTLHSPTRVATATLIDPGGLEKVGARFYTWMMINGLAGLLPRRLMPGLAEKLSNPVLGAPELKRCLLIGARVHRTRRPAPDPLTDDELHQIKTPTLMLLGEHSPLIHSSRVRERVQAIMSHVQAELVAGTRHGPSIECPDYVNTRILDFIQNAG